MALRQAVKYNEYHGSVQVTPPSSNAVLDSEVIEFLRLEDDTDTLTIPMLIKAATGMVENYLGCALINQSWRLTLDNLPNQPRDIYSYHPLNTGKFSDEAYAVRLPRWPLSSITSLKVDGVTYTVTDYFVVDDQQHPARLVLKDDVSFPVVDNDANGIQIEYVAGYGANYTSVPDELRFAVLQLCAFLYEHRGGCDSGEALRKSGAMSLISQYKTARL